MFNKRGQELSTSTIILLIIGVIILVLIVFGFVSGWSGLGGFISGNNVDSIRSKCNSVCVQGGVQDYCVVPRDLSPSNSSEKINDATCYYLANYADQSYGFESCGISCSSLVYVNNTYSNNKEMNETEIKYNCEQAGKEGIIVQYLVKERSGSRLVSHKCTATEVANPK